TKRRAPVLWIADERERLDERADRGRVAGHVIDRDTKRTGAVGYIGPVEHAIAHVAQARERLHGIAACIACTWRVGDEPVSCPHQLENAGATVRELGVAAVASARGAILGDDGDPVL